MTQESCMNRRKFMKSLAASAAVAGMTQQIATAGGDPKNRPNILWLDAEDLSWEIGCYGCDLVHTPNIDSLAEQGARFTNAVVSCPVCSPSRSAIWVGMYQTAIGAHNHRSQRTGGGMAGEKKYHSSYRLPEHVKHMTEYLRRGGYFCCSREYDSKRRHGKRDYNYTINTRFEGNDWRQCKGDRPFFAHVHFRETHRGFENDPEHPIDPKKVEIPPYLPDNEKSRAIWAKYLETVQILDRKVGDILKRLEDDGLAKNTVVFFTGDHGRAMIRAKQWPYDSGIRVPFVVRWPGRIKPGTVRNDLVNLIDLGATWLGIAGAPIPKHMHGRDVLSDEAKAPRYVFSARDRCDETIECIRAVSDGRYKYLRNYMPHRPYMQPNEYKQNHYPMWHMLRKLKAEGKLTDAQKPFMSDSKPLEELYDLETDPHEVNNLAGSPEHADVLKRMRKEHLEWVHRTGDLGLVPEPILEDLGLKYGNKAAVLKQRENRNLLDEILRTINHGENGRTDKLFESLKSKHDSVRWWAAIWLGNVGKKHSDVVEKLRHCLKDQCHAVRAADGYSLGRLGEGDRAVHVLADILKNSTNHATRNYAIDALEKLGPDKYKQVADVVRRGLKDHYKNIRRCAKRMVEEI